jgi:signal transduction histidine kinase
MPSLRLRLVATMLVVAAAAVAGLAVLSREAVRFEYRRLAGPDRGDRLPAAAAALQRLPAGAGRADVDARLAEAAAPLGLRLLLVGPDGRVAGASSRELADWTARGDGGQLILERTSEGRTRQMVLMGAPRVAVADAEGRPLGVLHSLPESELPSSEPAFVASVNRWVLVSAAASVALALGLALALSRRIVEPVAAMTAAARRMEEGDLAARVPAAGRDEIGALAHAFNAMADAVARAEASRRALVADVAHELRTPLTNLQCQIEALQDGLAAPDAAALRSLHEETLLLARLVGDLQDLALAEAGQTRLDCAQLPLDASVDAALAAIAPIASARGIALQGRVPRSLEVVADRERLAQVLRNLLANALTHTPDGGTIAVSAERRGAMVEVEVADTGPGIAREHLPHVFDRFYRADPSRTRATGGAGLGLAIVKQLVEAQGGSVGVASEPGRGARFRFTVPGFRGSFTPSS